MSALPDKIRHLRRQQQLNQQQLAYALGISQTAYSKLERGKTALTLTHVQKLARVFQCKLSALLE
ncbi:MAG: helix-turn-helix transcriptional regulator [Saprospiraceae bacterium]|nr:helix-turn-helix transcriptional regulator [Saprospiraceae bacterium]